MSDLVGRTLDNKYEIVAQLGSGGMAEVYRAYQPALERYVAIKMLHSHLVREPGLLGRFEREAATLGRLRHENIVRLIDFQANGPEAYMVMDLIEGITLADRLGQLAAEGRVFALGEVARVAKALGSAIDYAHQQGMIHRDLKPANIMFARDGQVVLTDFGIAHILGAARQTASGTVVGTPTYMSPEQCRGEQGDPRSDIYALGAIYYEMATGHPPFLDTDVYALIHKHLNVTPPPLREHNPALPLACERAILKALHKVPQQRYQTAGELADELSTSVGVLPPAADLGPYRSDRERFTEAGTLVIAPVISAYTPPAGAAAPTPPSQAPFQVPPETARFIGREAQVADFRQALIQPGGPRVFCFAGMGGIGKTALAIHLAHELRAEFSGGVLWANAATSEPLAIVDSWARAYGCDFSSLPELQSRAAALRGMLAGRRVLLVFDDVQNAERVRPLMPGGRDCVTIITTRDRELAAALNAHIYPIGALTEAESLGLLAAILGEARLQAEMAAAEEIGRLLGFLPLAVEIAAQRLSSRHRWKLADLVRRLQDEKHRLDELRLSDRELRASFAVSWNALAEPLRQAFACLGVFEGRPFSVGAAAAVVQVEREAAEDMLYALSALSLAFETEDGRYWQHPLLAEFACEHLSDEPAACRRMAAYYLNYAGRRRTDYSRLEQMSAHLAAGLRVAHGQALWQMVLDYAEVVREAWFARGRYADLRRLYAWAREAAQALGDQAAQAKCQLEWGRACLEQSEYAEAQRHLMDSLGAFKDLADKAGQAAAEITLGRIALEQDRYDEAMPLLSDSRRLREQLCDELGVAESLFYEARVMQRRGDYTLAEDLASKALSIQTGKGDDNGVILTLVLLARNALELGRIEIAATYGEKALSLSQKLQRLDKQALACDILSEVSRKQNRLDQAVGYAEEGLMLSRKTGDKGTQALLLRQMSFIRGRQGQFDLAIELDLQCLALCQELQAELLRLLVLLHLGDLQKSLGDRKEAQRYWLEALACAEALQDGIGIADARRRLAADAEQDQRPA